MKIGFNEATTMKRSNLITDVMLANQYGFDGIEIRLDKLEEYLASHSLADLKELFQGVNIKPWSFNALESATFRGEAGHRELLQQAQAACEAGRQLDCRTIIVVPSVDVGDETLSAIEQETVRVLTDLGNMAQDYGMRLAFEFIGYPTCSVNTFAQAYEIVERVNLQNVGLTLDLFHFHAMNSRVADLSAADPHRIFMVHLDDCDPYPPGYLRDNHRCFAGRGAIDVHAILTRLKSIGYQGPVSVETFRPEYWDWDVERTVAMAKETADAVVADVFEEE